MCHLFEANFVSILELHECIRGTEFLEKWSRAFQHDNTSRRRCSVFRLSQPVSVNVVALEHLLNGDVTLFTYNSVPWLLCM